MKAGFILGNRYEIVDVLGSGGMGKVYLARNLTLGTLWAIKEIDKSNSDKALVEVNLLKNLEHPSLPKVYDVIDTVDAYYVVFTYINGKSLYEELRSTGRFSEDTVIKWAVSICDVLSYLHNIKPKPVIYRDLKPSNIMLTESGEIKLIDFGIAREFKEGNSQDTVFIGTKGYAAPEQYGFGQSGPYTDIYSLGVTMIQLLTGKSPCSDDFTNTFDKSGTIIDRGLIKILEKCINKNIEQRYSTASDLKTDLLAFLTEKGPKAGRLSRTRTIIRTEKKAFFRQLVVSLDNPEFTSEFAVAASNAELKVLLVEIERFATVCDFFLGIQQQYQEYRIVNDTESRHEDDNDRPGQDIGRLIYTLSNNNNLSYLSLNPVNLNEYTIELIQDQINMYDIIIISVSINCLCPDTCKLFRNAHKILIPHKMDSADLGYWIRIIYAINREFNIEMSKMYYLAWLYDEREMAPQSVVRDVLDDIEFLQGISINGRRPGISSSYTGPAFVNYNSSKKEYFKILFDLNISPVGYIEKKPEGILKFLRNWR